MADPLIPKLGDPRLRKAGKQSQRTRKMTQIVNQQMKTRTNVYSKSIDKNSKSYEYRMSQKGVPFKQESLQLRSTLKTLKHIRQGTIIGDESNPFGVYGGVSLDSLRYEIDNVMKDAHPRTRRLKKVERMLSNGRSDGRLMDYKDAKKQLEMIIKRPSFPKKGEREMTLELLRPSSAGPTPEYNKREKTTLRLPPINISRENTRVSNNYFMRQPTSELYKQANVAKYLAEHYNISREATNFQRLNTRSESLPTLFPSGRSRTFMVETRPKRFSLVPKTDTLFRD